MVDIAQTLGAGLKIGESIAQAPQRNLMNQLGIQQAQQNLAGSLAQQQRVAEETEFNREIRENQIIHRSAKAFKSLPINQRASALQAISPRLQELGVDPAPFTNVVGNEQALDELIAVTQGFISDPSRLTSGQREFES